MLLGSFKLKKLPLCLVPILFLLVAAGPTNSSTPEGVLDFYISALRQGNVKEIQSVYYNPKDSNYYLPGPSSIQSYKIIHKKIYDGEMLKKSAYPDVQVGDVELVVQQIETATRSGKQTKTLREKYTYFLRSINGEWKIYSHYSWRDNS